MTIEEMMRRKKEAGYTYIRIAELTGIPLETVQKIFGGEVTSPQYDDILKLEQGQIKESPYAYGIDEAEGGHTVTDYYMLPNEQRVELIDGVFYDMAAPTTLHQMIVGEVYRQISNYIYDCDGTCTPLISPVDVQLDCDNHTMIQPDVAIICKGECLKNQCVFGAPDFVMEVVSSGTKKKDYLLKLHKYDNAGVREYWIVDPKQKVVLVYFFEEPNSPTIYGFQGKIPVNIYEGKLEIKMDRIAGWVMEGTTI